MSDFAFPFPVLVCDTGGTNVRFALADAPGAPLGPVVHLITDDYPGLPEAIEAAAPKLGSRPRSAVACGAGPVVGRTLKLTNAPWVMDGPETARRAGLAQGLLLNDFEAQALSLPAVPEGWARRIGALPFGGRGPQVILGPGTGLGIAGLIEAEGRFTPVPSEACHIDFGPTWPEEFELWPHLERAHGRVTSESVICGAGLARVHRARMMAARPSRSASRAAGGGGRGAGRPEGRGGGEPQALLADRGAFRRRHGGDLRCDGGRDAVRRGAAARGRFPRRGRLSRRASRPRRRSTGWRSASRPGSSPGPTPCWSAWRRSPRRPAATPSTTGRAAGFSGTFRRAFAFILGILRDN